MVSGLNKNFGGSTDLAKKRHGSADLHSPIHPPLTSSLSIDQIISVKTFDEVAGSDI